MGRGDRSLGASPVGRRSWVRGKGGRAAAVVACANARGA